VYCVPEVCSHEIVCVEDSVAPVAAAEEGAAECRRLLVMHVNRRSSASAQSSHEDDV